MEARKRVGGALNGGFFCNVHVDCDMWDLLQVLFCGINLCVNCLIGPFSLCMHICRAS